MERRKRKTKAEVADERRKADETKVVTWAEQFGAPITLLIGWNPDTGKWSRESPVGLMINHVQHAVFPTTAARLAGVADLSRLLAKGAEYVQDAVEDRGYIPVEIRPFIDLVREMDIAEGQCEADVTNTAFRGAKRDPKLALTFLARRFPARWREQSAVFAADGPDERDKAVSDALGDPNTAAALAEIGHRIEDATVRED